MLVLCLLAAMSLAAIWSIDYLPTHDGPQHIYTVHAANHLAEPDNGYGRFLEAGHPISAMGFVIV